MPGIDLPFQTPDFRQDIDSRRYLERVPPDARCKGMFFHEIVKLAGTLGRSSFDSSTLARLEARYVAFKDYPLRTHMEITAAVARPLFPDVSTREGLRRLGRLAFPTFASSMVGRVVVGVLGADLERILQVGPKVFELSLSHGRARSTHVGERHFQYEFTDVYGYLDAYYLGVMEGPIVHFGKRPDVKLHLSSLSDGVMDIRWS